MPKKRARKKTKKPAVSAPTPRQEVSLGVQAFLHSLGVIAYITFVAFLMMNAGQQFDSMHSLLGPIAFLLLFTLSAAVVGMLVFGRPVMLYLDGKKRDAVKFAGATIGFLAVEALILFITLGLSYI